MNNKEIERLANLCYYDFDMSEGEENCKNRPRYFKCREELNKEYLETPKSGKLANRLSIV